MCIVQIDMQRYMSQLPYRKMSWRSPVMQDKLEYMMRWPNGSSQHCIIHKGKCHCVIAVNVVAIGWASIIIIVMGIPRMAFCYEKRNWKQIGEDFNPHIRIW